MSAQRSGVAAVTQRGREFGIRHALGADPRSILALVIREGLRKAAIGIAVILACVVFCGLAYRRKIAKASTVVFLIVATLLITLGVFLLPDDLTAPLAGTLVRAPDEPELRRALAATIDVVTAELERSDPGLTERLRPMLAELSGSG